MLESLHPDDVARWNAVLTLLREEGGVDHLKDSIQMVKTINSMNKFLRKLFLAAVVLFGGVTTFVTAWNSWIGPYWNGHRP